MTMYTACICLPIDMLPESKTYLQRSFIDSFSFERLIPRTWILSSTSLTTLQFLVVRKILLFGLLLGIISAWRWDDLPTPSNIGNTLFFHNSLHSVHGSPQHWTMIQVLVNICQILVSMVVFSCNCGGHYQQAAPSSGQYHRATYSGETSIGTAIAKQYMLTAASSMDHVGFMLTAVFNTW